jgi:sulfur carrier protein ThiS
MKLYLGGYLDFYRPRDQYGVEVPVNHPTLLSNLLESLGIPPGEVHLAVINGQNEDPQTVVISDTDEVKLFSAVGGG